MRKMIYHAINYLRKILFYGNYRENFKNTTVIVKRIGMPQSASRRNIFLEIQRTIPQNQG